MKATSTYDASNTYHGTRAVSHGENVLQTSGEHVPGTILYGNDVERPGVPLDVLHHSHTPGVAPPRDHAHVSDLKLDSLNRLARFEVDLHHIMDLKPASRK